MIIMHHRTPTSSNNKLSQTHPLIIDNENLKYKYAFVHNGMISNADDVKKAHEQLGFEYLTAYKQEWTNATPDIKFNDSESLAIELARFIEKQTDTLATMGSVAFIGIQINRKTNKVIKVFFGRNTSPLNLSATRGKIRLSSESKGNPILENTLYSFEPSNYKLKKTKMELAPTSYARTTKDESASQYSVSKKAKTRIGFKAHECYSDRYDDEYDRVRYSSSTTYELSEAEDLAEKLEETVTDGEELIIQSLKEFTDKIVEPKEILNMNLEAGIQTTCKELLITLRDMYNKNVELALNASYATVAEEVKKELNNSNKKNNEENSEKSNSETENQVEKISQVKKTITNQRCLLG